MDDAREVPPTSDFEHPIHDAAGSGDEKATDTDAGDLHAPHSHGVWLLELCAWREKHAG